MVNSVVKFHDDTIFIHTEPVETVGKVFEKGFYRASFDQRGNLNIKSEKLPELHTPFKTKENTILFKTVEAFFAKGVEEKINKLGFLHKLGVLLYGKQGTAKTAILHYIANTLIEEKEAVVIFCDNSATFKGGVSLAQAVREIQNNPIVFIADEFDQYCDEESALKNFLDGKDSVPNSLFMAATNYIDKVPKTLKERPSRFKLVLEIKGITDKKVMKNVMNSISNKISPSLFTNKEIDDLLKDKDSATIDEIKHLCLDKATNNYLPKQAQKKVGFKSESEEDEEDKEWSGFFQFITSDDDDEEVKYDSNI